MANTRPVYIVYSDADHAATLPEAYRVGRSVNMINARVAAIRKLIVDNCAKRADLYNEHGRRVWTAAKRRDGSVTIESVWDDDHWILPVR